MLRPGNAGSSTAAGHIEAVRLALAQLPQNLRRRVLIRADSGGGTHEFLAWLTRPGRRLHYSVGFPMTDELQAAILAVPKTAWTPAYECLDPAPTRQGSAPIGKMGEGWTQGRGGCTSIGN
jgi:DDE family transposase